MAVEIKLLCKDQVVCLTHLQGAMALTPKKEGLRRGLY